MERRDRFLISIFIAVAISIAASISLANTPEQDAVAERIFLNAMSPYCPGKLLANCPTSQSSELKKRIFKEAGEGKSYEQIMEMLYGEFGEETIRSAPKLEGFGRFAWLMPLVFFAFGGAIVLKYLKKNVVSRNE